MACEPLPKGQVCPLLLVLCAVILSWLCCGSGNAPAYAQSFDCAKARTAVELAICADASLQAQDTQLAEAYQRLLAATPARQTEPSAPLRQEQHRWLQERDRICGAQGDTPARLTACLTTMYRTRHAALLAALSTATPTFPPTPAEPSARLSENSVSAAADGQVTVTVETPGRFAIRAVSKTGVALQLVDMIIGPGDIAGEAGGRDGRVDVLLDKGVYKLRSFGAKGATAEAQIVLEPFRNAAAVHTGLLHGGEVSSELADLQQRTYWTMVDKQGRVTVEAVGRALQDLRLWRNGTELATLTPTLASVETRPGRFMTRLRLEGQVEPGLYLITAYGGTALPWSNEDKAQPLHLRVGNVARLLGGWAEGTIGAFGSRRFEVPPPDTYMRLEVPESTPVRLLGRRQGGSMQSASVTKASREPLAALHIPLSNSEPALLEVVGFEGQSFRLRTMQPTNTLRVETSGPHLISVDVAGEGGDELPATAVVARFDQGKGTVLAANAPRLGAGQAWRRKFNLRGVSTLLFEMTSAGPLEARASGPGVRLTLESLLGHTAPRADGRVTQRWDVEPGWYSLRIEPIQNAAGVLDLTIGQPGLAVDLSSAAPPRSALTFGVHHLVKGSYHQIFTNTSPGLVTAPTARALPVNLAVAPLRLFQTAAVSVQPEQPRMLPEPPRPSVPPRSGRKPAPQAPSVPASKPPAPVPVESPVTMASTSFGVPVYLPSGGNLRVVETTGSAVAVMTADVTSDAQGRRLTVHIPPTDHDRVLLLTWVPEAPLPELPAPAQQEVRETLTAGKPHFFNLALQEQRSMLLQVPTGGLYRVETLGRLKTSLQVATPFVPDLASAADNGPGHNALLQTYLRAGVYRVTVSAQESVGHLGLVATPALLPETAALIPAESVRASLVAGRGALIPIEVTTAGVYHLQLYGLNRTFLVRLEDAEGWPLSRPQEMSFLEQRFEPGRYRLVVMPSDVDARLVVRLTPVPTAVPLEGHGPHALLFDQTQHLQWREPEAPEAPRMPDRWVFTLHGPAQSRLEISDGMIAELLRADVTAPALAKVIDKRGFAGELPAGRYVVEARSLGRNDRLDYHLTLRTTEMQPEQVRLVHLPATIPFAIAQERIVSFTTFGSTELSGVLQDADGRLIERLASRSDDWNLAFSRRLAAGRYQLVLSKMADPASAGETSDSETREESDDEVQEPLEASAEDSFHTGIEVRFALPEAVEAGELTWDASQQRSGAQVQQFLLPVAAADSLVLVAAQANAELVLALERRDAATGWRTVGLERGKAPVLAMPADGHAQYPWRLSVWALDGGRVSFRVAARTLRLTPQAPGQVTLAPLALDGLTTSVAVAQVTAPSLALLSLRGAVDGMRAGSTPGRILAASTDGLVAPQSERLWLLAGAATTVTIAPVHVSGALTLTLNDGEMARLPSAPVASGYWRFWHASSAFAQVGLDAGQGMGIAAGSTFGQDTGTMLRLWNADGNGPLRLRVAPMDVQALPSTFLQTRYAALVPAHSAQAFDLAPAPQQFDISLAAGVAAVLSGGEAQPVTLWAGDRTVSRTLTGSWTRLVVVNTGSTAVPATVDVMPGTASSLAAGQVFKRFVGAAGTWSLQVDATSGDQLTVAGASATFLARSGAVLRGTTLLLPGPGELVLEYEPGLVAAWIERQGLSPWPDVPARQVTLPQRLPLQGEAMVLGLEPPGAALLRVRTTAPLLMSVTQGDAPAQTMVFAMGATLYRYLVAGSAELRLYTPYDGPLSGSLELTAMPIEPIVEGLGEARAMAPGGMLLFGFEVTRASEVGVGVRSEPDRAEVRVLDAAGRVMGEGIAQMRRLEPGRYLLEVRAPSQGATLTVRPALVGLAPPPSGPPPDIVAQYLDMVGLTPSAPR